MPKHKTIHYVYKHVDPVTDELLYIGHGTGGRAWIIGSDRTVLRSKEHFEHLDALSDQGFLPPDWVHVIQSGLTKSAACQLEQALIRDLQPTYNKPQGKHLLKLTAETVREAQQMRLDGVHYNQIAEVFGVSTMTVYRALNGQTKNLGEAYGT